MVRDAKESTSYSIERGGALGIGDLLGIKCRLCPGPVISAFTKDNLFKAATLGTNTVRLDPRLLFLPSALDKSLNFYESQLSFLKSENNYIYFTGSCKN